MKTRIIFLSIFFLAVIACNKDKFLTVPQVKIKNIVPDEVSIGDNNNFTLIRLNGSYTDDEGDIDSVFIIYKWYNGATATKVDTFKYTIGALGVPAATREADITIEFVYGKIVPGYTTLGAVSKDTTATFGLILVDKMLQRSDYAESKQVRLLKP